MTEQPGSLRLKTGSLTNSVEFAQNTLTQRTEGPKCSVETALNIKNMKVGDSAGLVALQHHYGTVGIMKKSNGCFVTMCKRGDSGHDKIVESVLFEGESIYLRTVFNYVDNKDTVDFYYSDNQSDWIAIGETHQLAYTLDHFMGCRVGLFNYASENTGGFVDFNYFNYENKGIK